MRIGSRNPPILDGVCLILTEGEKAGMRPYSQGWSLTAAKRTGCTSNAALRHPPNTSSDRTVISVDSRTTGSPSSNYICMKFTDWKTTFTLSKTDTAWGIKYLQNTEQNENYTFSQFSRGLKHGVLKYAVLKQEVESCRQQTVLFACFKAKILFMLILVTASQSHLRSGFFPTVSAWASGGYNYPTPQQQRKGRMRPLQLIVDLNRGLFWNSYLS